MRDAAFADPATRACDLTTVVVFQATAAAAAQRAEALETERATLLAQLHDTSEKAIAAATQIAALEANAAAATERARQLEAAASAAAQATAHATARVHQLEAELAAATAAATTASAVASATATAAATPATVPTVEASEPPEGRANSALAVPALPAVSLLDMAQLKSRLASAQAELSQLADEREWLQEQLANERQTVEKYGPHVLARSWGPTRTVDRTSCVLSARTLR